MANPSKFDYDKFSSCVFAQAAIALAALTLVVSLTSVSADSQTLTTLYVFSGQADGAGYATLVRDASGNLYGTSIQGGDFFCQQGGCGTVYEFDSENNFSVLHTFGTTVGEGFSPASPLILDAQDNLYGTTTYGGDLTCDSGFGCGTIFRLDRGRKETVLYAFKGGGDGAFPYVTAGLTADKSGDLFGTTYQGGAICPFSKIGCGVVFQLNASGITSLHGFTGMSDGAFPTSGVILDEFGNIYGTASQGGSLCASMGCGVVFEIRKNGVLKPLHTFGGADGAIPYGGLVGSLSRGASGTTLYGGDFSCGQYAYGCGIIFQQSGTGYEVLHTFIGSDGALPNHSLVQDVAGNLYGTTVEGGDFTCPFFSGQGCGTIFKIDSAGNFTILYRFTGGSDGGGPGGLTIDAAGNLFGTTNLGGNLSCPLNSGQGCGTIFKLAP